MLNILFNLYLANILFGIFAFFILHYLLKKYLNINMISIFKNGFSIIKRFLKNEQ
jgi:hypothetical protein